MRNILKPAAALFAVHLLLKLAGPIKNILIAHHFGISRKLDAYFIAQNIVDVILATLTFSFIIVAIPLFSKMLWGEKHQDGAEAAIKAFLCQSVLFSGLLTVVFMGASKPLSQVVPGFDDALSRNNLHLMMLILGLSLTFAIPVSVMTGYFHAIGKVVLPSLFNTLPVLCIMISILVLKSRIDIFSLPIGFLAGGLFVFLILARLFIRQTGRLSWSLRNLTVLKAVANRMAPAMVFAAGGHINLLVDQLIASHLKDGGVSILGYAQFFVTMPFMVITVPLITALFPEMSKSHAMHGPASLSALTARAFAALALVLTPVAAFLMILKTPVIGFFYNHGYFDPGAVEETAGVLMAYVPTILFLSLNNLLQRLFFIRNAIKILTALTVLSIGLNVILDIVLSSLFSITGIAAATSALEVIYFFFIILLARKRYGLIFPRPIKADLFGIGASGVLAGTCLLILTTLLSLSPESSWVMRLCYLIICGAAGGAVYLLMIRLTLKKGVVRYVTEP